MALRAQKCLLLLAIASIVSAVSICVAFIVIIVRPERAPLTTADVRDAGHSLATHLASLVQGNGEFLYRYRLGTGKIPARKYNVLRHAGAVYALAKYQERSPDVVVHESCLRAAEFLKNKCMSPVDERIDLLAIWSDPQLEGEDGPLEAKLGGAGLALVALTSVEKISPGETPLIELRSLGRFVIFMQKPDGSFYSKYIPSRGGLTDDWTSLYYPGEAALGLAMLYQLDPDVQWLASAARVLAYLARTRAGKQQVEADHWALLATAELLPRYELIDEPPATREELVSHGVQVCRSILAEKVNAKGQGDLAGCFTGDGRTTPTATRLEGLHAALGFLPQEEAALREQMEEAIREGIAFLLRARVSTGKHAGAMPGAVIATEWNGEVSDSTRRLAKEGRIDYVQHALCALLQHSEITHEQAFSE